MNESKKNSDFFDFVLGFTFIFILLMLFTLLKGDFEGLTIAGKILKAFYTGIEKISRILSIF